jgi:predicted ester cyclase
MSEELKATIRRVWNEVAKGNLDALDEIYAPDVVAQTIHHPTTEGLEAYKQGVAATLKAWPDAEMTFDEIVVEGDVFASRWTFQATHTGPTPALGIKPTGKRVTWTGCTFARMVGGKCVEEWMQYDNLGLLQQVGVIPGSEELSQK